MGRDERERKARVRSWEAWPSCFLSSQNGALKLACGTVRFVLYADLDTLLETSRPHSQSCEGLVRVWLRLRFISVEAFCLRTWLGLAGLPVVEQRSLGGRASSQRGAVLQLWWLAILSGP